MAILQQLGNLCSFEVRPSMGTSPVVKFVSWMIQRPFEEIVEWACSTLPQKIRDGTGLSKVMSLTANSINNYRQSHMNR